MSFKSLTRFYKYILKNEPEAENIEMIRELMTELMNGCFEYKKTILDFDAEKRKHNDEESKRYHDVKEYQYVFKKLDDARSVCHTAAIGTINALNRQCKRYDKPLLFDIEVIDKNDTNHRQLAGEFMRELADECVIYNKYNVADKKASMEAVSMELN